MPYSRGDTYTPIERGHVVLVAYPHSDQTTFKQRPALIVQPHDIQTGIPQFIMAMITSNMSRTGPTRVAVSRREPAGVVMGIKHDSVIMLDNLATIRDEAILKYLGFFPLMAEVDAALRVALKL